MRSRPFAALTRLGAAGLLARTRGLFFMVALLTSTILCASIPFRSTAEPLQRGLGMLAIAWIVGGLVHRYRTGRRFFVLELVDTAALACVGIGLGGFSSDTAAVFFPSGYFFALYGSRRRVLLRAVVWVVGLFAASHLGGAVQMKVFAQAPPFFMLTFVLCEAARIMTRNDLTNRRQSVQLLVGNQLVAEPSLEGARTAVLEGLFEFAGDLPQVQAAIALVDERGAARVVRAKGDRAGELIDLEIDLAQGARRTSLPLPGLGRAVVCPLAAEGANIGALVLVAGRELDKDVDHAVRSLGLQLVLAMGRLKSEERLASLVEHSADALTVVRAGGVVAFASPAFASLTGRSPDAAFGKPVATMLHPEDAASLLLELAREDATPKRLRLRWRHLDGSWRETETSVSKLAEGAEWVLNTRDVSDRAALEMELRQAQKLESIGRLAAGVAHEINTPVQAISSNLQFLEDSFGTLIDEALPKDPSTAAAGDDLAFLVEEVPAAIAQMRAGTDRVAAIVRAMRSFGDVDASKRGLVDINESLANAVEVASGDCNAVADVVTDFKGIPAVDAFEADLNTVFLNLLVNAAHAIQDRGSSARGTIAVSTRQEGGTIVVTVADDGVGMAPEVRDRVFDQFFTTKEVGRGTGQGLALARAIVKRHGGSIDFESEVGVGTTFTVRLPVDADQVVPPLAGAHAQG